jgi:hypothetical protein
MSGHFRKIRRGRRRPHQERNQGALVHAAAASLLLVTHTENVAEET